MTVNIDVIGGVSDVTVAVCLAYTSCRPHGSVGVAIDAGTLYVETAIGQFDDQPQAAVGKHDKPETQVVEYVRSFNAVSIAVDFTDSIALLRSAVARFCADVFNNDRNPLIMIPMMNSTIAISINENPLGLMKTQY